MDNNQNKKTVLVVEDDPALQEAIKLKLEKTGVDVIVASDGEEALNLVEKTKFDLVWLDLLMPRMDGLEFLKRVKENEKLKDLAIIMVSASGSYDKVNMAHSFGILDYILKGDGSIDDIINKVKKFL